MAAADDDLCAGPAQRAACGSSARIRAELLHMDHPTGHDRGRHPRPRGHRAAYSRAIRPAVCRPAQDDARSGVRGGRDCRSATAVEAEPAEASRGGQLLGYIAPAASYCRSFGARSGMIEMKLMPVVGDRVDTAILALHAPPRTPQLARDEPRCDVEPGAPGVFGELSGGRGHAASSGAAWTAASAELGRDPHTLIGDAVPRYVWAAVRDIC